MDAANNSLWNFNTPANFWCCSQDLSDDLWQNAFRESVHLLGLADDNRDLESVLKLTLGEGRFGKDRWNLGPFKRGYYRVKPLIPRPLLSRLRRIYNRNIISEGIWPIEHHYVDFLWEVMRQILIQSSIKEILFKSFWPDHSRFALILTHDIETADGQEFVESVADLEESLGFRSLFNFIPEKYHVNHKLMDDLRQRGFEIGVHGLRHDGRLFDSKLTFLEKANRINQYIQEWKVVGFRAELTHRQPEWMQALDIEYDLSFFDTDPFEPIPGGTMSIWPFIIGSFVELPYTLVQDHTLTSVLGENSPRIWFEKVDFIEKYHGMALVDTHPDYLRIKSTWDVYNEFLIVMKTRVPSWHALPHDVASWWRSRTASSSENSSSPIQFSRVFLEGDGLEIEL